MIEIQARKLLFHLASCMGPGKSIDWVEPDWLPHDRNEFNRDAWIPRLARLAEDENIHLIEKNLNADSFQALLAEMIIPIIVFSKNHPILLQSSDSNKVLGHFWTGTDFESRKVSQKEVMAHIAPEPDGSILMLAPVKADPLVSSRADLGEKITPFRRLLLLLNTERRDIFYIYVYAIFTGLLSLTLPLGVQTIVGQVAGGLIMEPAVLLITLVIVGTAIAGGLQIMQAYIVEKIQQRLFARAAFEFAARMPRLKLESILNFYPPELMNRFFDILTIQKGFSKLLNDFIGALLSIVFGLILLSFYHPFFILFGIILVVMVILIFRLTGPRGLQTSLKESKYKYRVAHWLEEIARTLHTFKLAGYTRLPVEKMDREVTHYLIVRKKHFQVIIAQLTSIVVFKTLITGGLLILGSVLVVNKQITLGQFVASEIIIITVLAAVEKVVGGIDTIYDLLTAVEKIGNVTDIENERTGGVRLTEKEKGLHLKIDSLNYTFPGKTTPSLKDITFEVKPGEKIGITGSDGSGKTTLLRVIAGLLSNYSGSVSFDNISLRKVDPDQLRLEIGDVQGMTDIFDGTLTENLTLGRPGITTEDLIHAMDIVGLREFLSNLPDGLQTHFQANDSILSSGTVKRIVLARNILGPPRMLIFNDFFVNLPADFRYHLRDTLFDSTHKWTILASTQDPVFLEHCDRIIHLENGSVVASGTYKELCKNPSFCNTVISGFSKSES